MLGIFDINSSTLKKGHKYFYLTVSLLGLVIKPLILRWQPHEEVIS